MSPLFLEGASFRLAMMIKTKNNKIRPGGSKHDQQECLSSGRICCIGGGM